MSFPKVFLWISWIRINKSSKLQRSISDLQTVQIKVFKHAECVVSLGYLFRKKTSRASFWRIGTFPHLWGHPSPLGPLVLTTSQIRTLSNFCTFVIVCYVWGNQAFYWPLTRYLQSRTYSTLKFVVGFAWWGSLGLKITYQITESCYLKSRII